jgi:hypothetical protein
LIPSLSPSVKIQIRGWKICLRCKGNVLPLHLKQIFSPIIWIFTEGEGDGIKSRLPFEIFSTLVQKITKQKDWNYAFSKEIRKLHYTRSKVFVISYLLFWSAFIWQIFLGKKDSAHCSKWLMKRSWSKVANFLTATFF